MMNMIKSIQELFMYLFASSFIHQSFICINIVMNDG